MSFRRLALASGTLALVACGYPSFGFIVEDDAGDDGATDSMIDDTRDAATTDAPIVDSVVDTARDTTTPPDTTDTSTPCPILTGGDVCTSIPKLPVAAQVVDGDGSEFCALKATTLVATSGALMEPTPPPSGIDSTALIRVAWSSVGLHIHVHVDQPKVYAPSVSDPIWYGDGLEIFAVGYDMLTGWYDGKTHDPGAMQIIATPPDPARGIDARAELWEGNLIGAYSKFAARVVPGGYEEEFEILWEDLHATGTPASGTGVAFDLGLDVRQSSSVTTGPLLQSFVYFAPDPSPAMCDATRPRGHPSCDDKNWCKTKLE